MGDVRMYTLGRKLTSRVNFGYQECRWGNGHCKVFLGIAISRRKQDKNELKSETEPQICAHS